MSQLQRICRKWESGVASNKSKKLFEKIIVRDRYYVLKYVCVELVHVKRGYQKKITNDRHKFAPKSYMNFLQLTHGSRINVL
jgi:hypothetical protein